MYRTTHHVLACTAAHCTAKGANDVLMLLRREVMKRGLDKEILVNNCGTIDLCDIGPNIVVYPDNVIYSGVTKADVPELVDALASNTVLERLVLNADTPAERARHDFYAEAVAESPTRPADAFTALAAAHGLDEAWLGEQQRRGFIARKPATDETPETITVTTKARTRYGV
ncbi:MAG: (2Fe-2S) ferredoxin domain-containing protein [Thermomicrobiales bacterium]|nr:(2Fe-2S) ferredoxin domain-containing protein [Thermomicrobiales bacterium]